jgi:hypothetical protein
MRLISPGLRVQPDALFLRVEFPRRSTYTFTIIVGDRVYCLPWVGVARDQAREETEAVARSEPGPPHASLLCSGFISSIPLVNSMTALRLVPGGGQFFGRA